MTKTKPQLAGERTQENKVLRTGSWYSIRDCPSNPKNGKYNHRFEDKNWKPSGRRGERLVTSQCLYCGALIVDCPTISAPGF